MKNNAYITFNDIMQVVIYDKAETIDLFGEDFLEEYGSEISEELLARYKNCMREFSEIQQMLKMLKTP